MLKQILNQSECINGFSKIKINYKKLEAKKIQNDQRLTTINQA